MYPNGRLFGVKLEAPRSRVERVDQGRSREQIGLGWSDKSENNQRKAELVVKREVRGLDRVGSDQRKNIGLEKEDHIKKSRSDDGKKIGEDNSSLWKCPEG